METYKSKRVNAILGKELFKNEYVSNDEVKKVTGLTLEQLLRGFIFSGKNSFNQELKRWQETREPMRAEIIFNNGNKTA